MNSEPDNETPEDKADKNPISKEQLEEIYNVQPKKIGFFRRVYRAVVDHDFYRLVAIEPAKKAFFYFVKLILLASVISGTFLLYQTIPVISEIYNNVKQQIRPMTFQDGAITVEGETPQEITLVDQYKFIIDPNAKLNRVKLPDNIVGVLVDGGLYYRMETDDFQFMSTRTGSNSENPPKYNFNQETMETYKTTIFTALIISNLFGAFLLQVIMNTVRLGLVCAGGWLLTRSSEQPIGTRPLLKMTCYVLTPLVGIDIVFSFTGIPMSSLGSTYEIALLILGSFLLFQVQHRIMPENPKGSKKG